MELPLPVGAIAVTSAGRLPLEYVTHVSPVLTQNNSVRGGCVELNAAQAAILCIWVTKLHAHETCATRTRALITARKSSPFIRIEPLNEEFD